MTKLSGGLYATQISPSPAQAYEHERLQKVVVRNQCVRPVGHPHRTETLAVVSARMMPPPVRLPRRLHDPVTGEPAPQAASDTACNRRAAGRRCPRSIGGRCSIGCGFLRGFPVGVGVTAPALRLARAAGHRTNLTGDYHHGRTPPPRCGRCRSPGRSKPTSASPLNRQVLTGHARKRTGSEHKKVQVSRVSESVPRPLIRGI